MLIVKILDVTEFWSERGGGVRSHLTEKGRALAALGHQHVVVAPGPTDSTGWLDAPAAPLRDDQPSAPVAGASTRLIRVVGPAMPYDSTYHLLARIDRVRDVVLEERPDVLEVHSPYLAMIAALQVPRYGYGVRTFWWHADFVDTYLREGLRRVGLGGSGDRLLSPVWALVRSAASKCDATFVASRDQADKLRAHSVPRVIQVPFGVDKSVFRPDVRSASRRSDLLEVFRRRRGTEPQTLLVGVGRFAIEKRWDVVLDALAKLRAQRDAVLVLFGDGPERSRMERHPIASEAVHFPGFERNREALASALASADVLVHGCPHETFGLSIAEALSCGLPVVVPDRGGAFEVGGPSGVSYKSLDAAACAEAIQQMLEREPGERRAAALEAAAGLTTVEGHMREVLGWYDELLLAAGRRP